jgi:hypothetical protein
MADKIINVDIRTNTTGVKSLKTELRETIQLLQQTTDPKAFEQLSLKAAELKDRMAEVNESVNALATGSKYEKVTKAFGEMGAGLRDMDFDRVVSGSKLFAKSASAITFKDAIGSVKQMGSALMTVGKAILTNPLFLIAGVITLIVVGIVKLMDKLGILKKIFEFVGGAIDAVVQGLKDFLDWIGLTNFAAEDAAERQAAAAKKSADAQEAASKLVTAALDYEIEKIKASGDESDEAFEKVLAAEKEKRVQLQLTAKERYLEAKAAYDAALLKGELDREEIVALKDKAIEMKAASEKARGDIEIGDIAADTARRGRREKNANEEKADYKARVEAAKKFAQDRLNAERLIEDLKVSLIEDDTARELEATRVRFERLRENTLTATTYTQEEKNKIIALYNQQEIEATQKVWDAVFQIQKDALEKMALLPAPEIDTEGLEELVDVTIEQFSKFDEWRMRLEQTVNVTIEQFSKLDTWRIDFNKRWKEDNEKLVADMTKNAQANMGVIQNLSDSIFAAKLAQAKKGSAEEERLARKQFDINKKLQIAQALIQAPQAIMAAYSSGSAIPIVGAITGPLFAAAAAITTAAQISKIKNATFSGGGSVGGGAGASAPSVNVPQANMQPSTNLYGQANQGNNASSDNPAINNNITVQAVVSESEVTGTQAKVNKMKQAGVL